MKGDVLIYEKDREALAFLQSFFEKKKQTGAEFFGSLHALRKALVERRDRVLLCIADVFSLEKLNPLSAGVPVIATITKDVRDSIRRAVKHGAENYLISPFHREDLSFKIKSILDKRQMVEKLRREARDLQTVVDLTYLVSSTLDPQEILYLIVKKISEVITVTRCSIIRVDGDKRYAYVVSTFENPKIKNIRLDLAKYPEIRYALTSKKPVIIRDINTDPLMEDVREIIFPLGIRSIVVIPIIFREEVIGTLFLRTSRTRSVFNAGEIRLCSAIANVSANSLYNAFLFEKMEDERTRLEKLAITDFLTGVYNIRYFYHRLTEEFSRSERYNLPLSCLMLDIDHFKEINDRYGHKTGDVVLREFAQLLKKHTRKSDVFARYGGEEFIMLLAQTPVEGALKKAETLRAYVEKYRFRGLKGKKGPTVSIGVASYPELKIAGKDDLITFADNALYEAKTSGRNQVVVYKP